MRTPRPIWLLALLAPGLLLVIALVFLPLVEMAKASLHLQDLGVIQPGLTLDNYIGILGSPAYFELFYKTAAAALAVTLIDALLAYPVALHLVAAPPRRKAMLYFLVAAPLLINTVVRTYAWMLVLGNRGVVNTLLISMGVTDEPIRLSGNVVGMMIGATQVFLPFMILALAASLESIDRRLIESAEILGAGRMRRFITITLPLSMPGLVAGSVLVFSLMLGAIVTPLMLGGSAVRYVSVQVFTDAMVLFDLPRATALSALLLVAVLAIYVAQRRYLRSYQERAA